MSLIMIISLIMSLCYVTFVYFYEVSWGLCFWSLVGCIISQLCASKFNIRVKNEFIYFRHYFCFHFRL